MHLDPSRQALTPPAPTGRPMVLALVSMARGDDLDWLVSVTVLRGAYPPEHPARWAAAVHPRRGRSYLEDPHRQGMLALCHPSATDRRS